MCRKSIDDAPSLPGTSGVTDWELQKVREEMDRGTPDPLLWWECLCFCFGATILICILPFTIPAVGLSVLWDAVDRGFMGKPQDGVIMSLARWINIKTENFWSFAVKKKEDAFMVNLALLLGIFIPAMFFLSFYYTLQNGFNLYLCAAYHMLRLGPYFMNFGYVYSACHKECHSYSGIFTGRPSFFLNYVFNWWIGLFYGVLPSTFAFGHAINHHRYNNGPADLVTTSDKPRDSFRNFVAFVPRFFSYATNTGTVWQFFLEEDYDTVVKMNFGTLYFIVWAYIFYSYSPVFALWYIVMPLGENIVLLSGVSWCWHAFLSHKDPEDDFIGSVTLLDGPINVMEEDYHVVHHMYPGCTGPRTRRITNAMWQQGSTLQGLPPASKGHTPSSSSS